MCIQTEFTPHFPQLQLRPHCTARPSMQMTTVETSSFSSGNGALVRALVALFGWYYRSGRWNGVSRQQPVSYHYLRCDTCSHNSFNFICLANTFIARCFYVVRLNEKKLIFIATSIRPPAVDKRYEFHLLARFIFKSFSCGSLKFRDCALSNTDCRGSLSQFRHA